MAQEHTAFNAPLIAKLEAWGYEDKSPTPLADIISALDSPSLALVERLSNDITHVNERSYDLRVKVAALTDSLKQERLRVEQLVIDNQTLLKDKDELSRNVQELKDLVNDFREEGNQEKQVQQWRAQSMHQLQELESMNQALRSTLNLHTSCAALESKDAGANQPNGSAKITLTKVLVPRNNSHPPLKPKVKGNKQKSQNLMNVAAVKCKLMEDELHLWKQKHTILEDKLHSLQKEFINLSRNTGTEHIALSRKEGTETSESARQSSKVDVGVGTMEPHQKLQEIEGGACSALLESKSDYCRLMDDLLSLFQDYEKELIALAAAHLSEVSNLIRQGTPKHVHEVSLGDKEYLEKAMLEFLSQLEPKSKQQGLAALCTEETNYHFLRKSAKMNGAREELDTKFGQKIIHMIKSVISLKDRTASRVAIMKAKLEELLSVLESQKILISSLRAEITKKTDEITFIMDEKVVGEEALQASQLECNELASLIKEIDGSMVQLTTALATRTLELDQESEARMSTEQELRKRYSSLLSQLEEARNQVVKLQTDLEQMRGQEEKNRCHTEFLTLELQNCTKRMETAERDVEQLKTLIIQLDLTREDLVAKLKSTMLKEQQAEKHMAGLEAEVGRLRSELEIRTAEVDRTCSLVEVLGGERDHLQSQLTNVKEKLSLEEATRNRLEELWTSKSNEYRATAEELATFKGAHQRTFLDVAYELQKIDLVRLSQDNTLMMDDLRNMTDKVNQCHQALSVREKEQEDLFHLYQSVCNENQQLKVAVYEMENQIQQQLFHQQSMEEMLHKAEEQVKILIEENGRVVSDLKGLERQADLMTRSLNQQSGLLSDYENEKAVLVSQLCAAKVAINDLEAKLSTTTIEMDSMQQSNLKISELLQANIQEVESLSATHNMEQERIKSLEHLLACVRAEEQKLEMTSKEAVTENLVLKERISDLQEQVNHLQMTRNTQNQDIMRLQMSKNRTEGEEGRRLWSTASYPAYSTQSLDTQTHQLATDLAVSKTKTQELEKRIFSVTADLTKTTSLYEDCFSKLQRAESRFVELRKEFDHMLSLLSKVDEERKQLEQKCAELEGAAINHSQASGNNDPIKPSHPDIVWMQKECHRLKKEAALWESIPETVAA